MVWAILGDDYNKAITEIILSDSDRIIAVVGGAMLDHTVSQTLTERLRDNKDISRKLFKPTGPLGNLVPKIDLAYQLYAFSNEVRDTLYGLSEIRNFLAHRLNATFETNDKKLTDAFHKLLLHKGRSFYPDPFQGLGRDTIHKIEPVQTKRDRFLVNLKLCLIYLMADRLSHAPNSNLPLDYFSRAAAPKPSRDKFPSPKKPRPRKRSQIHKGQKPPPRSSPA